MPELLIPDAYQRGQALDITQSWIVEAPAGSGKTGLLIQRYLKLLACDNVTDPAQVLAITFTRKATAEMQERVLAQLTAARDAAEPANSFDRETRALAQAVLARDSQLNWNLIDAPRSLRIRTIDSVAAEISRSLPILSGAGGPQATTDDAGALHAEAAHRTLMLLGGPDAQLSAAIETLLLHRDGSLTDAAALLASMLGTRDQWGELVPLATDELTEANLDRQILPRLEKALELAICRGLTRLTQVLPASILTRLCTLAAEMAQAEGYKGAPTPILACRDRFRPPADRAHDLDHWRALIHLLVKPSKPRGFRKSFSGKDLKFDILKQHQAELKQIIAEVSDTPGLCEELCQIDALPPAQYPPEQWHLTKALFRILSRALVELQFVFAEHNTCDFAEVGLLARTALRRDSALDDLRTSAGSALQHLLVDEMQDTSTAQYELIQLLTQRWDGGSQTVFLVGDPKQSIYLFRQARVERFVRTLASQRLGDVPLHALHLTANFRSQRSLVEHFNLDFAQIFPSPATNPGAPGLASEPWEEPQPLGAPFIAPVAMSGTTTAPPPPHEVPFRRAHPMRADTPAAARVWHAESLPYARNPAEASALRTAKSREYADLVRQITQIWQDKDATIAVLVRNRTHLLDIVKAFKQSEIPYRAVEIEALAERQEILDLLALTRALLQPADRTAWLAILRAPWCGLTLPDLHTLAGEDDPTLAHLNLVEAIQQRGDLLSPDGIARLEPFWSVMSAARRALGQIPTTALIERTWQAFAAPQVLTPEALANTARYFELLDELDQQPGPLNLDQLGMRLGRLYAAPSTHPGAVDLLTIHKSKGLEWDVVFVPALEKTGRVTTGSLLNWLELEPEPVAPRAERVNQGVLSEAVGVIGVASTPIEPAPGILAPIQARGNKAGQLIAWMRGLQSAREAAERKRLFYVACTRAREELHLFAALAQNAGGELKPRADTLLHAAWPAAQAQFQPAAQAQFQPAAQATILPFPAPVILDTLAAEATLFLVPPSVVPHDVLSAANGIVGVVPAPRVVERIPQHLLPAEVAYEPTLEAPPSRPEGGFTARIFGNAMHALLELVTRRLAAGIPAESLVEELPSWQPRFAALLRAAGLGPAQIIRQAANLERGLANTLCDQEGLWVLSPHPEARSEASMTTLAGTLRLDRTFLAGASPGSTGQTHLWIVDYKTSTHAREGVEDFLAGEKSTYEPQLAGYARGLGGTLPICLGLYHPMLARLTWWPYSGPDSL